MPDIDILAAAIFGLAVVHTFSTKLFEHLANEPTTLFFGALGLTAITDNAALTYLARSSKASTIPRSTCSSRAPWRAAASPSSPMHRVPQA
jgi:hypothetical protein